MDGFWDSVDADLSAIGNILLAPGEYVYDHVIAPTGDVIDKTFSGVDSIISSTSSAATGIIDFAKYLPWIIIGIVALVLVFLLMNPKTIGAFL